MNYRECVGEKNRCVSCFECFCVSEMEYSKEQLQNMSREELENELIRLNCVKEQLNTIIEKHPNPIFITNGEGEIIKVNAAYEKLSNTKRINMLGFNIKDMVGHTISYSSTLEALRLKKNVTVEQKLLNADRIGISTSVPLPRDGRIVMVISGNFDPDAVEELQTNLESEKRKAQAYWEELEELKRNLLNRHEIIAQDKKTLEVLSRAHRVAAVDSSVLIVGETGTGKEEFAKYIHSHSMRRDKPFITVNCGAIPQYLIESEFFGYEKGAFTGASPHGKEGLFEIANDGTIFLDEIAELPIDMQVKLLRVLQEQEIRRVGGKHTLRINVRVICATNKDLKQMIVGNTFRADLYYRLSVVVLEIPPLRERRNDIVPLAAHFADEINKQYGMQKTLTRGAYQVLKSWHWPGNVRELKNVLEELFVMSASSSITKADLALTKWPDSEADPFERGVKLEQLLNETELKYLNLAMAKGQSIRKAALYLGMPPTTYARRLKHLREKMSGQ